jgi:hypothetical protein
MMEGHSIINVWEKVAQLLEGLSETRKGIYSCASETMEVT